MSITDELRKFYERADGYEMWTPKHKAELDSIAEAIETELAERYVALPLDADGVPIRARDKMCQIRRDGILADPFEVAGFELVAGELWPVEKCVGYKNNVNPRYLRHYHEPTVEHQWAIEGETEEVVRCRDCKRFALDHSDHDYRSGWWCHRWNTDMVKPDGFCAWGKRRNA